MIALAVKFKFSYDKTLPVRNFWLQAQCNTMGNGSHKKYLNQMSQLLTSEQNEIPHDWVVVV